MDRECLKGYQALKKEIKLQEVTLDRLYRQQEELPVYEGRVKGSNPEFPFNPRNFSANMVDPVISASIKRRIEVKEELKRKAAERVAEIEEFIAQIEDPGTRNIFELVYVEGKTHREAAEVTGYSRQAVTKIISNTLKE